MRTLSNQRGVSLLELLFAGFLVAFVGTTLALAFPQAARSLLENRQRAVAVQLAMSQIEKAKSPPYAFVDTTDDNGGVAVNATCNCRAIPDFSVLPSTTSQVAGTSFITRSCIHYVAVGPTWPSQCAVAGDTGYKEVLVFTSWTNGGRTYTIQKESMLTRS